MKFMDPTRLNELNSHRQQNMLQLTIISFTHEPFKIQKVGVYRWVDIREHLTCTHHDH